MSDHTETYSAQLVPEANVSQGAPAVKRTYKDALFRKVFEKKEDLLSLYNAVNGSHYEDANQLETTTIDDVLYLGMKNDASFLIDQYMNLYEHQSTRNPNMPIRGMFYFSRIYQAYIKKNGLDLFSEDQVILPTPKYLVFYNGKKEEPDRQELRMSSAYKHRADDPFCLECIATVLNINVGHNQKIMQQCDKLYGYAYFVNQVRVLRESGNSLRTAIDQAADECIKKNLLKEFLVKHRTEVTDMLLCEDEYLTKLHMDTVRKKLEAQQDKLDQQQAAMEQKQAAMEQKQAAMEQKQAAMDQKQAAMDQKQAAVELEQAAMDQQQAAMERKLIGWVCSRIKKNLSAAEIAEDLEEPLEHVAAIMEAAKKIAPDYDPRKIQEALKADQSVN